MNDERELELKKLTQDAQEWISSQKGQAALKKALEDAKKSASQLEEERKVNPDDLHRHFDL